MAGTFAPSVSSLQMHLCSFPLLICLGCGKLVLHILFFSKMVQLEHFVCSFLFVTCWHLSSRALICSSYNNPVVNWLISMLFLGALLKIALICISYCNPAVNWWILMFLSCLSLLDKPNLTYLPPDPTTNLPDLSDLPTCLIAQTDLTYPPDLPRACPPT